MDLMQKTYLEVRNMALIYPGIRQEKAVSFKYCKESISGFMRTLRIYF